MVDLYVSTKRAAEEPLTWTGLALFLGFSSRSAIDEYLKYDGFSNSVKRAKAIIEENYERLLHEGKPVGAIFALKNFNWTDKRDVGLSGPDGGDLFAGLAEAIRTTTKATTLNGDADED